MNLDAGAVYEGFPRRLLAGLVDTILLAGVAATVALVCVIAGADAYEQPLVTELVRTLVRQAPWWLAGAAATLVVMWAFVGATPGMLLVGSRVVASKSGRNLSLARSAARVVGLVLGLAALGIGVLWCIRDPRHQGLHDKLVRSLVVREDESLLTLEELVEGFE